MKFDWTKLIGAFLLGIASAFGYSFKSDVQNQVTVATLQAKVETAIKLCPANFEGFIQKKDEKEAAKK